jgi:transcriptional regulator GlxA family with amidase domain
MLDVTVLFLDGGHASTSIGPLEIFRDAGGLASALANQPDPPRFRVRSASIGGRPVRPEGPCTIQPDQALEAVSETDLVFVPSGGVDLDALLARNAPVVEFVRRAHARGARVAGVCSGVALLAASGILDRRSATTHWGLVQACRARFPRVEWRPDDLLTESDRVYTGGGVYAALDLALYLVEALCGHEVALRCARGLLIDMPRSCQAGFAVLPLGARHADESIRRAEEWIHRHCREPFRFEALARELGMSPRNFIRRFKGATGIAPVDYLQRLRVRAARRLLEETRDTVQEIGAAVGYGDAAFFRSLFRRHTGLAPAAYRGRFASRSPDAGARAALRASRAPST